RGGEGGRAGPPESTEARTSDDEARDDRPHALSTDDPAPEFPGLVRFPADSRGSPLQRAYSYLAPDFSPGSAFFFTTTRRTVRLCGNTKSIAINNTPTQIAMSATLNVGQCIGPFVALFQY